MKRIEAKERMGMRKFIVYLLFFVSYSPLFFYMGITSFALPKTKVLNWQLVSEIFLTKSTLYFLVGVLSIAIFFVILRSIVKTAPYTKNVVAVEEKNVEYLSYVMTYFIAFLDLKFDSVQNVLGSVFLFCFIAFVYSKSNLIYSNPVLAFFGFNIYEGIVEEDNKKIMIISKEKSLLGKNIPLIKLTSTIYLRR